VFDILYGEASAARRDHRAWRCQRHHRQVGRGAYNGEKIGQGKDNTREFLREHPEMADEIEAKIRGAASSGPGALRARGEPAEE
jgi:recombination protein RecA